MQLCEFRGVTCDQSWWVDSIWFGFRRGKNQAWWPADLWLQEFNMGSTHSDGFDLREDHLILRFMQFASATSTHLSSRGWL